jgi:hypothetical protein
MKYQTSDSVLANIGFSASPVNIEIDVGDSEVRLTIANRDFWWNKETGVLTGSGCSGPFQAQGTPAVNQGDSADSLQQTLPAAPGVPGLAQGHIGNVG